MSYAVKVENLKKSYGDHTVLKGLSFHVKKGEVFALLGGNGAGKTTALECVEGLRRYDSGAIAVNGRVGIQLQSSSLPAHIRPLEAVRLFAEWNRVKADTATLAALGINSFAKKQYLELSTGQKRRLHLALALLGDPELLFLDEPTAGLDVEDIKRGITLTARAAGKSILVTDAYGSVVLSIPSEYQGMEVSVKTCNATYSRGIYDEMGTLGGIFSSRYYIAGKPILDEKGMLQGFVFAGANADSLTEYLANLFSTFILSAGLMLMVSSVLSIVLTNRMTTPLRRISDAAKKFGGGDFSARVPVEGDDELAQLAETFNTMAGSLEKICCAAAAFPA